MKKRQHRQYCLVRFLTGLVIRLRQSFTLIE